MPPVSVLLVRSFAGLDGVAAPPLQYIAFPKSSALQQRFLTLMTSGLSGLTPLLSFYTEVGGIRWDDMTVLHPAVLQALLRMFVCLSFVCF